MSDDQKNSMMTNRNISTTIEIPEIKLELNLELVEGKDNKQLCNDIFKMFSTVPQGMTNFQIRKFILGDLEFPTIDSKWWQAKLELWVRMQNVIGMHYEYRKKVAKIKELKTNIDELNYNNSQLDSSIKSDIQKKKNNAITEHTQVEIEENEFTIACIKKGIVDKLKEMSAFWNIMKELEPKMTYSKENKDDQEEEYWIKKAFNTPELVNRHPEVFADIPEIINRYKNIYNRIP